MFWAPLLVLCALCAGLSSQAALTQEPSVSVSPGSRVQIVCVLGTGTSISDRSVSWYQQKSEATPRYLLSFYSDSSKDQGSGVPARFSGSKDTSKNSCTLTITGAQNEDDAVYYCLTYTGSGSTFQWIFGGGTQLSVVSGEIKAPTLSIFPPSTEEIATQKATLVCQCQDFYPAALSWTWTVNGETITTGVGSTRPTKQTDNNLFMAGSLLSIDAIDWNADKKYTCMATHEGKTFQASVKHSECV